MRNKKSLSAVVVGLVTAGALMLHPPKVEASGCVIESSTWTESIGCPTNTGFFRGKGWGAIETTTLFGLRFSIRVIYAWLVAHTTGGTNFARATGLDANGGIVSGCTALDSTYDLYPVGDRSGCGTAVRHALFVGWP
jgi:hypothetical protein